MDCNLQQVKNNNVAMTGHSNLSVPYKMNAIVRVGHDCLWTPILIYDKFDGFKGFYL